MDPGLIALWLHGLDEIPTLDEASVALARETVRRLGSELHLSRESIERAAVIASELGTNQLRHARHGRMAIVAAAPRDDTAGLEIVAADHGPGIASPRGAFEAGSRAAGSLGVGLASVRRMATEIDVDVRVGEGTCVRARVFDGVVARRREIGIFGRAYPGEALSGDHACFIRRPEGLLAAVVDGLGHGLAARTASVTVVDAISGARGEGLPAMLEQAGQHAEATRGVAVTLLSIDASEQELALMGVGNVAARVESLRDRRSFQGAAGVLGGRGGGTRRAPIERIQLRPHDVVAAFTDGLTSRATLEGAAELLHEHPIVIAEHLLATFGRTTDDALVLVAR